MCDYINSEIHINEKELSWNHHFESFTVATMTWLTVMEHLCHKWQRICSTCKHFTVLSSFMTYHMVCNYIKTTGATSGAWTAYPSGAPEFTPVFSGVHVTRSLVLYVCFVDRCLSFCTFSFGHCVVCSSSIYELWLPLWYLQTLLHTCFSVVYVVKLHVFTFLVPCCDVDCDFSHLLFLVEFLFYLCYLYLFKYTNVLVSNTISISDDVRVV
jgi:hypothetical protein